MQRLQQKLESVDDYKEFLTTLSVTLFRLMIPSKLNRIVIDSFIFVVKFIRKQANMVVHLYISPLCIRSLLINFFSRTLVDN